MDFKLPDLGEGVHEGQILAVHVKEGQTIHEDELLLEVETDKAAVEIPSPCTGIVTSVHVKDKQLVHVGDVLVTFNTEAKSAPEPIPTQPPTQSVQETVTQQKSTSTSSTSTSKVRSSPYVRKFARSVGVDISTINGTDADLPSQISACPTCSPALNSL